MNVQPAAADFEPRMVEIMLFGVGGLLAVLAGLAAFVCFIMVVVKMFQNDENGMGIVSLVLFFVTGVGGYLFTLIYGWMKATQWSIKTLMAVYTFSFLASLLSIVLMVAGFAVFIVPKMQALDAQQEQQMQDLGDDVSFEELVEPIEIGQ